jgi:hypothetical protein
VLFSDILHWRRRRRRHYCCCGWLPVCLSACGFGDWVLETDLSPRPQTNQGPRDGTLDMADAQHVMGARVTLHGGG